LEGDGDSDFGPADAKRAKTIEDEDDDFGPKPASSTSSNGKNASSGQNRAEWERVRLEAEVGDVTAVDQVLSESDRAEWMTVLPAERKEAKALDFGKMQQNVTSFSKRGVQRRGDTSSWTDTPSDRAARESGSATMSSLDMARQLAAQRFQREEQDEARSSAAAFNTGSRGTSLYEQTKRGTVVDDSKKTRRRDSESESDESDESDTSDDSSSSDHRRSRSHRHKEKSKDKKSKDKHRHKDKRRDKDKQKDKDRRKEKRSSSSSSSKGTYDEQTPKSLSTADVFGGSGYWDRERDLVSYGNRVSEQTRAQTFRDAALLNSRFYSGGTSTGPSNLRK